MWNRTIPGLSVTLGLAVAITSCLDLLSKLPKETLTNIDFLMLIGADFRIIILKHRMVYPLSQIMAQSKSQSLQTQSVQNMISLNVQEVNECKPCYHDISL